VCGGFKILCTPRGTRRLGDQNRNRAPTRQGARADLTIYSISRLFLRSRRTNFGVQSDIAGCLHRKLCLKLDKPTRKQQPAKMHVLFPQNYLRNGKAARSGTTLPRGAPAHWIEGSVWGAVTSNYWAVTRSSMYIHTLRDQLVSLRQHNSHAKQNVYSNRSPPILRPSTSGPPPQVASLRTAPFLSILSAVPQLTTYFRFQQLLSLIASNPMPPSPSRVVSMRADHRT
jgi:hypothetical protein